MAFTMELELAREKAAGFFGDASPAGHTIGLVDIQESTTTSIDFMNGRSPIGFDEPGLLYFALTQLLDLCAGDRGDKVAWSVPFEFKGACFAFELRKAGLRFMWERHRGDIDLAREVHGRVCGLVGIAARHLRDVRVPLQLKSGNVTIPNYYMELHERYRFFRQQAEASFAALPVLTAENARTFDVATYSDVSARAGHFATACVDAYFSCLEHLLVLSLGFVGDVVEAGDALAFLEAPWRRKAATQLQLDKDPNLKIRYEQLLAIRREWRNPAAHGGFKRRGESFSFHVPGGGALPVVLCKSEGRRTVGLSNSTPAFGEVVQVFDAFDQLLDQGALRYTLMWARSGLELALDNGSRQGARAAMTTPGDFTALIKGVEQRHDREANVEF